MEPYPGPNAIRILITSDNHVGYNETDPIQGDDSWKTFEEIATMAKTYNVDMILQGGDLFHTNKPSKKSMYQVMKSLRLACMGEKPCELELLSDPRVALQGDFDHINYEDPNFNVSIPVFCISGNHDDASGDALLSPMDILQVSGLVNHVGKVMESDKIEVSPLLFQKGVTKLALYGLASVRDERLFRTFKEGHVKFNVPEGDMAEWFNIICVHQNHTGHTNTAFLPEQFLPDFLDLVVWGHEHECIPNFTHNPLKNFDVLQPGSSIATSLCDAESRPKNAFILEYESGATPRLHVIPLKTVRPFVMKEISLKEIIGLKPHDRESITKYLIREVESMIEEANRSISETEAEFQMQQDERRLDRTLPLVRLRVDYSAKGGDTDLDYQVENPRRFSNRFVGRVANTHNVVQFYKRRKQTATRKRDSNDIESLVQERDADKTVQTLISDLMTSMSLSLLPEVGLNEAVSRFVDKDEKGALKEFIDSEVDNEVKLLASNDQIANTEDLQDLKKLVKQLRSTNPQNTPPLEMQAAEQAAADAVSRSTPLDQEETPPFSSKPPTKRKTSTSQKKSLVSPLIVESDEDILSDHNDKFNDAFETQRNSPKQIALEDSAPKKKGRRRRFNEPKAPRETTTTKTPKTDILNSLLARKRG
ncbi:LAMI_0A03950g1_1 [Lachancea mirantina]|uniref:Double-strand break repair protein n=1 Tax=Lachancea mirantina TaxID=1230905 RepID=A0A1G4INH8_9SACH|nr:LAMI_0A03950g1_1 [Lachancea mirantina]